jgi:MFS family permease
MDRRTVIATVCIIATLVAGSIAVFRDIPHPLFLLLAALFSGFALTLYSLSVSHINDKLEPKQMVAASGAILLLNGTAAAAGPLLAGSLMAAFGPHAYFATLATLTGLLLVYDVWRKSRRGPVPASLKAPFVGSEPRA